MDVRADIFHSVDEYERRSHRVNFGLLYDWLWWGDFLHRGGRRERIVHIFYGDTIRSDEENFLFYAS